MMTKERAVEDFKRFYVHIFRTSNVRTINAAWISYLDSLCKINRINKTQLNEWRDSVC